MKKLFLMLSIALLGLGVTSCVGESKNETSFELNMVNLCTPAGGEVYGDLAYYGVTMHGNEQTMDITMRVRTNSTMQYQNVALAGIPFTLKNGCYSFNVQAPQNTASELMITNLQGEFQVYNGSFVNIKMLYSINMDVSVVASSQFVNYYGCTTSTGGGEFAPYTTKESLYGFVVDFSKMKASLEVTRARFWQDMSVQRAFILEGLNVKCTPTGFQITADEVVPRSAEDNLLNDYKVTDFSATLDCRANVGHVTYKTHGVEVTVDCTEIPPVEDK